ncbi:MAG TPA: YkgJ family cysteine cluster protein [Chromatiales bacterium]|nr:YkgJ family cysteine cluster protein [Chromatiales bacterium]
MKDLKTLVQDPPRGPVEPVQLGLDDRIQFRCHKGIDCFNQCCMDIDITLTPYDILRLSRRLDIPTSEFLALHAVAFEMDQHGMPGYKLRTREDSPACQFVTEEGCGVYEDRPAACRYYALGSMGLRRKDSAVVDDLYFLVKESHCHGHQEPRTLTVREYRREQGVEVYDDLNREWRDIILKKRSSGLAVGSPTERSFQLFHMASYDLDGFRRFVLSTGFRETFGLEVATYAQLEEDDEALLRFSARFLKQVLFGEQTIPLQDGVRERRMERRRRRPEADKEETGPPFDPRYDAPQDED